MDDFFWDDIKYFLAFGREKSISKVAEQCGVEHSTIVRRLTRLETSLSLHLFNRLARGWTLSEEGQRLLDKSIMLEKSFIDIKQFSSSISSMTGNVTITAPPGVMSGLVVPALAGFDENHPDISLTLLSETRRSNLSRGEADIALRMSELKEAELVTRTVCHVEYNLYSTRKWLTIPDNDRVYIGYSKEQDFFVSRVLQDHVGERSYFLRSNDIRVIFSAVKNGYGIGLLPTFMPTNHDDLVPIEGLSEAAICPVYLVMQRDVRHSPRVRAVADHITGTLKKNVPNLN